MTEPRQQHALIVPIMQARVPVEMQLELPLPPDELPVREALVGDLYATYLLDSAKRYEYVTPRHCARLGIRPDALRAQAAVNLRNRRPELAMNWYPDARAVSVGIGNELEAGLLLDDVLMDKLAQDVDGDLVVAVPARPLFVATGTGHRDGLEKLRWTVDRVWAGGDQLLTRDLLVRRGGSWEVLAQV
jgi:uncharacterized protein YtpQ (UPF0354 family)